MKTIKRLLTIYLLAFGLLLIMAFFFGHFKLTLDGIKVIGILALVILVIASVAGFFGYQLIDIPEQKHSIYLRHGIITTVCICLILFCCYFPFWHHEKNNGNREHNQERMQSYNENAAPMKQALNALESKFQDPNSFRIYSSSVIRNTIPQNNQMDTVYFVRFEYTEMTTRKDLTAALRVHKYKVDILQFNSDLSDALINEGDSIFTRNSEDLIRSMQWLRDSLKEKITIPHK